LIFFVKSQKWQKNFHLPAVSEEGIEKGRTEGLERD